MTVASDQPDFTLLNNESKVNIIEAQKKYYEFQLEFKDTLINNQQILINSLKQDKKYNGIELERKNNQIEHLQQESDRLTKHISFLSQRLAQAETKLEECNITITEE